MNGRSRRALRHGAGTFILISWIAAGASVAAAGDDPVNPAWAALRDRSNQALSSLTRSTPRVHPTADGADAPSAPRMIVVGFTGGLEGKDSRVSGVVRMRKKIEQHVGDHRDVVALTFNNRDWRPAAAEVLALTARGKRNDVDTLVPDGDGDINRPPAAWTSSGAVPLIVVYGHSWGAGAITRFARVLREEGVDVALAVYIDAFSMRNPRVPDNVRYAVNLYQRTGIFRGLPLRGKSKLVLESPESTVVLANLRITPDTEHFGWNWNIVQPLLYRHHHRMGHDVHLQSYLLDLIRLQADRPDEALAEAALPVPVFSLEVSRELPPDLYVGAQPLAPLSP